MVLGADLIEHKIQTKEIVRSKLSYRYINMNEQLFLAEQFRLLAFRLSAIWQRELQYNCRFIFPAVSLVVIDKKTSTYSLN